jgi:tetratricopeptide (TPR) repeat protein
MKVQLACAVLLGLVALPLAAVPVPVQQSTDGKVTATEILNAGYAALGRKEYDAAERAFNDARRVIPSSPRPLLGLAEVARMRNSEADVRKWLDLALKLAPNDAEALQASGRLAIANADWKRAEELLVKATKAAPDNPSPYVDLGEIYFNNLGEPAKAVSAFQTAVKLNPQLGGAQYGLGMSLLSRGDAKSAEAAMQEAVRLAPENVLAHLGLGQALAAEKKLPDAIREYDEAIKIAPKQVSAYVARGDALSSQGRWADSIKDYSTATTLAPASAVAQLRLGMAYHQTGDARKALAAYDSAIKLDGSLAEAHNNRAWLLADEKQRLPDALESAQRAAASDRANLEYQDTLAHVHEARGEYGQAIDLLRQIAQKKPDSAKAHYRLGSALAAGNQAPEARQELTRALQLDANFADAAKARSLLDTLPKS